MNPCMKRPITTVSMYQAKDRKDAAGSFIPMMRPATRKHTPIGEYLKDIGRFVRYSRNKVRCDHDICNQFVSDSVLRQIVKLAA